MITVTVLHAQSFLDVVLQATGSIDSIVEIAEYTLTEFANFVIFSFIIAYS